MYKTYQEDVEFYLVYIREAHPVDGWQVRTNVREGIEFKQPTNKEERKGVAKTMCTKLELSMPTLIDGLDDAVGKAYSGWPDRLYLVGKDGKIAYKGGPGPRGFQPAELEAAIRQVLGKSSTEKKQSGAN